jgi:hypothetical protein
MDEDSSRCMMFDDPIDDCMYYGPENLGGWTKREPKPAVTKKIQFNPIYQKNEKSVF